MYDYLASLLEDLDGIQQHPKYHPEGDALFHSLQVFQLARQATDDPVIWAAALFHDVGKAVDSPRHAELGAEMLTGVLNPRIVWLVEHHLDLMQFPHRTRNKYAGQNRLQQLQLLRRVDVGGRDPMASVMDLQDAIQLLKPHHALIAA
ncbi:HD domain-containing protein [Microbulbifer pacificus]|uniref:HD domain-containing protein n=1 Tax=Microbulbifer pacificus TaxID=407164 RepID=A0AAU0MYS4_9GAMM|nr:HD domain-containing protein [Microbulbifer pacificus]WOX05755.1 HD domain-containing protein [Microbulbifer pacificus]